MPESPPCVGTYERDHPTCNGDPKGKTEQDRVPCAWRNRCAGLRLYCEERGEAPEFIVAHRTYEKLIRLCETAIGEYGVVDGRASAAEQRPKQIVRKPKKSRKLERTARPRRRPSSAAHRNRCCLIGRNSPRPAFRTLALEFERGLRGALLGVRFVTEGVQVLVRPGTIYRIDRTARTGYLAWYCTTLDGPRPIARLRFLPHDATLDVELPASLELLREALDPKTFALFRPQAKISGYFQSKFRHINSAHITLCVETIAKLIKSGAFELRGCFGS